MGSHADLQCKTKAQSGVGGGGGFGCLLVGFFVVIGFVLWVCFVGWLLPSRKTELFGTAAYFKQKLREF